MHSLHRFRFKISTWMLIVSLLASLPMLAFAVVMLHRQVTERQQQGQEALQRRTKMAAIAVSRELRSVAIELRALAQADIAVNGDLSTLYAQAKRVVAADDRLITVLLTDRSGKQLFNTDQPFGTDLPAVQGADAMSQVFDGGNQVVATLLIDVGEISEAIAVAMPMTNGGVGAYALTAYVQPSALAAPLNEGGWPEGWTAAVIDQRYRIVSRSSDAAKFVGQLATPSLISAIKQKLTSFRAFTKTGVESLTEISDVPALDWNVVAGRPVAALQQEIAVGLRDALIGGFACVALSMLFAFTIATYLKQKISRIVIGDSRTGGPRSSSAVAEIDDLAKSLSAAKTAIGKTLAERDEAQRDALTNLRGRALFHADAEAMVKSGQTLNHVSVALLYIDLDGFKDVNDTFGHDAGDRVLAQVGRAVLESTRSGDVTGRIGGDEFAVALSAPTSEIASVSERVADSITTAISQIGSGIGCSIGIAHDKNASLSDLIRLADTRMLTAKKHSRRRYFASLREN